MVLKGFIGPMRSGKTLTMVMHAYQEYLRGKPVYSNIYLSFPHTRITPNDLHQAIKDKETDMFDNACLCIDELHVFMDARNSGAKRNVMLSYFITQSGKLHNTVLWTSQFSRQVDVRVRLNTSQLYKAKRLARSNGRELSQDDQKTDFVIRLEKYVMTESVRGIGFVRVNTLFVKEPSKWFSYYDTREKVYYEDQLSDKEGKT